MPANSLLKNKYFDKLSLNRFKYYFQKELISGSIKYTEEAGYYYCTNLNGKNNIRFYYGDRFQYYNPGRSNRTCWAP